MACVVIKDRFGECHATRIEGEANTAAIRAGAGYLAHSVAVCDDQEWVSVGIATTNDAGAARLATGRTFAEGGIEWLYSVNVAELPMGED